MKSESTEATSREWRPEGAPTTDEELHVHGWIEARVIIARGFLQFLCFLEENI
jgi:hypothetical protein